MAARCWILFVEAQYIVFVFLNMFTDALVCLDATEQALQWRLAAPVR
jgi:hypothetical protein